MSGFSRAMQGFESATAGDDRQLARCLLQDILTPDREVRFTEMVAFHHYLREHHFELVRSSSEFVRPGGRHLFYQNFQRADDDSVGTRGGLLLRVKTSGTFFHQRPHMTLSLAVGLEFDQELGKFNARGELVPKLGPGRSGPRRERFELLDHRTMLRMGGTMAAVEGVDDAWADSCHFDFVQGFQGGGAQALHVWIP